MAFAARYLVGVSFCFCPLGKLITHRALSLVRSALIHRRSAPVCLVTVTILPPVLRGGRGGERRREARLRGRRAVHNTMPLRIQTPTPITNPWRAPLDAPGIVAMATERRNHSNQSMRWLARSWLPAASSGGRKVLLTRFGSGNSSTAKANWHKSISSAALFKFRKVQNHKLSTLL